METATVDKVAWERGQLPACNRRSSYVRNGTLLTLINVWTIKEPL